MTGDPFKRELVALDRALEVNAFCGDLAAILGWS
jgi:hypothetical protein